MSDPQEVVRAMAEARRQVLVDRMAKARAVRMANLAAKKAKAKRASEGTYNPAKAILDAVPTGRIRDEPAKEPNGWLDGIGHAPNGCPTGCNAHYCVITHENVCAHPDTSLQAKYLTEPFADVFKRFKAAQAELNRLDAERAKAK